MKKKLTLCFQLILFIASLLIALTYGGFAGDPYVFMQAVLIYWVFTSLYSHLNVSMTKGNITIDYGIHYSLSLGLYAGPLGIFIFEFVQRFITYFTRRFTHTADEDEFAHTFYNIGSFAFIHSLAFYLFTYLYPTFSSVPFGFWILIIMLVSLTALLSDLNLIVIFILGNEIKTVREAIDFIRTRSIADLGKTVFSNGLLFVFLMEQRWDMIIALFILNYLVSYSFSEKHKSLQHKMERDKFKQMAYTDFLTEVYNRAYMAKTMDQLNHCQEKIAIVVIDIDFFKKVNDTYNHSVGDRVIQHIAAMLSENLSDQDFLFRSGGEEFTLFLHGRSYTESITFLEELRKRIANTPAIAEFKGKTISVNHTASIGMYYYKACEALDIQKAYVFADQLLLEAKRKGKNQLCSRNGLIDLPLTQRID
ncbi:MAG TPA: GGDEF domain-containing protein [Cerasibacillus sp.]|uniref:GGDEF domain-containing protein n=1 Tax=Cerasibacillus sp. TaxID=2498711 RepID=UPI002F4205D7